jgi:HSP20 family protein
MKKEMMSGIGSALNSPRTKNRLAQEFATPFDMFFDEMVSQAFPGFTTNFGPSFFEKGSYPKVNVINQEDSVLIEAAVPGLEKEDISIEISEGVLTICGNSNQIHDSKNYVHREIKRSSFSRSFRLDENLEADKIFAEMKNGLLLLSIPKRKPEEILPKTRKISIS